MHMSTIHSLYLQAREITKKVYEELILHHRLNIASLAFHPF